MPKNESLRQQRIGHNWRQQDVADQLGTTVTTIGRWERGDQQPGAYFRVKLCTLFGKSAQELGLIETSAAPSESAEATQAGSAPFEDISLWTVPYARNPHFTGRDDVLQHLGQQLAAKQPGEPMNIQQAVLTQAQAISGLGGIGKSQIAEDRTLSIHRLVQAVQVDQMDVEAQRTWSERAVRAVGMVFPADPQNVETWSQCLRYLEQVQACDALIQSHQLQLPEAADLLDRTGTYLREHRLYTQAESLYLHALAIREQHFGPDHPRTADSLSNLGVLYRDHGRYIEVEPLYLRVLAIREQHATPDDLALADALDNLASIYESYRQLQKAEPLCLRALAIREQHFGPDHPQTAVSLKTLGNLYMSQGRYEEAEPCFQRALAIREQRLGPDHPHTADSLNNVAIIYKTRGRYEEAELCYQRALAIRERHFGSEHLRTADTLNNVGILFTAQGRYQEAEVLHQRVLAIRERHFGPDHPHTADSLSNLSILYHEWGKHTQAEALVLRALPIHEEHLGPDHAYTAEDLETLASIYRDQGKEAEAESLFLRALQICAATLVPTSLQFAKTLHAFALLRHVQGRHHDACALYQQALVARTHVLGARHPLTIDTREHLTALLRETDRAEEATQLEGTQPETTHFLRETTFTSRREESTEQSSVVASGTGEALPVCPQCHQVGEVIKSGKNRSGSQRFRCRACQLYFTPQPATWEPDQARKAEVLALVAQGMSYRRIARQLGVHHQTVSAWINTPGPPGAD